ncbi:glycosyltransferase family 2 protein [Parapedobacter sp. DT-150]|uniref:glycosyltransferase family 2 protein n=1 Tax=Parapedobacter sp. DT-150 TaxID=3396162 RepID=UPI003F1A3855
MEQEENQGIPLVSVLMLAYNVERFVGASIQSVLDQSFGDFELIIYNDGSTDETAAVIRQYPDPRIRFYDQAENKGLTYARQATLAAARGKYVAILDSDDISIAGRLEKQYRFLEEHPNVVLCGGNALLMDEAGEVSGELLHRPYHGGELKVRFFFNNIFVNSSVMYRRELAVQVGGYRERAPAEDYDLFVRLSDKYDIHTFNEPLVYYRIHAENSSQTKRDVAIIQLRQIKDEQLSLLGVDSQKYGPLFDALLWWRLSDYSIGDFLELLAELKSANRISGKLPTAWFEKELYARWYDLVMNTVPKKQAAIWLTKKELFERSLLNFKQKRRIVKLWLRSLF